MPEFIRTWWQQLFGAFVAAVWVGGVSQKWFSIDRRVSKLEGNDYLTKTEFKEVMKSCQGRMNSELAHGTKTMDELREQYKTIIDHLLEIKKNG